MNKHTSQRASTACKQHTGFPEDLTTWRCLVGLSMWMCACTCIHTYLFECVIFDLWNAGASIAKQYRWQSLEAINNQIRSRKQQRNQKQIENITRPDDKETHTVTTRQVSLPLLRRRCNYYYHMTTTATTTATLLTTTADFRTGGMMKRTGRQASNPNR